MTKDRLRLILACLVTLAIALPIAWFWWQSLMPSTYAVTGMGYADYGGGTHVAMSPRGSRPVGSLTVGTDRPADQVVDLVARRQTVRLASGQRLDGYTLNGTSPGPTIRVRQGALLEVRLRNANVPEGVTLHWHGMDVPNADDGVAGVTQDAVRPGGTFTYRFVARDAGTYWYHSHQVSDREVEGGLFGAIVVSPRHVDRSVRDVVALAHTYDGVATINGLSVVPVAAQPGQRVRVRVVNSDNGPTRAWCSTPYEVVAVDGHDVNRPTPVRGRAALVTAGGRIDLELTAPADGTGARVQVGESTAVVIGARGLRVGTPPEPARDVDLLSYGSPAPLGFDPTEADRHFTYHIGRTVGFVRGKPGLWWTVDGHLFPHMPMFVVREGDVVRMHISNTSGDVHPVHLHGHHAVVLARDGVRATGSPWWFDSLNVADKQSFDVAFVANNPGVWMDHCHNLEHASQGLVTHLMYAGVSDSYRVGGPDHNEPE